MLSGRAVRGLLARWDSEFLATRARHQGVRPSSHLRGTRSEQGLALGRERGDRGRVVARARIDGIDPIVWRRDGSGGGRLKRRRAGCSGRGVDRRRSAVRRRPSWRISRAARGHPVCIWIWGPAGSSIHAMRISGHRPVAYVLSSWWVTPRRNFARNRARPFRPKVPTKYLPERAPPIGPAAARLDSARCTHREVFCLTATNLGDQSPHI